MRRGDVRRRSPPQSRFRNRDYFPSRRTETGTGERRFDRSAGSTRRDYEDMDSDRDVQSRRLSEFNESLGRGESTAMKFQWKQLLGEPKNVNPSLDHPNGGYDFNRGGTSRTYQDFRYSDANEKNYQDIIYPDKITHSNLKSYEDARYSGKDQKNYDGARYTDMQQKSYEGTRYSDMNLKMDVRYSDKDEKNYSDIKQKSYEGTRYSDTNLKSYEDARYSDKDQKNYDGFRYSDIKQKRYEDARYSDKDQKSYDGGRYSDVKYKSYEGTSYLDTNPKSYENARYPVTNPKSYEDARYSDKDQNSCDGFRYSDASTKSYDTTRYSDISHKSYEDVRAKSYLFYSPDVGISKVSTGNLGDGFKLPSLNLKLGFHKDDPYNSSRIQPCSDKVPVDKSPVRKYKSPASEYCNNKEERNLLGHSQDFLDYSRVPFSGSKAIGKKPLGVLEEDSLGRGKSYSEVYEKRDLDYSYHIPKDDEVGDYKEFHATKPTFGEKYSRLDSLRSTSVVDPIVERLEECSHREQFYDSGLDISNYLEVAPARKQEREVLGFDITNGEYKTEVYEDHGSLHSGESDDFERDDDYWTHEESYKNLLMEENHPFLDEMGGASSRTILKRKRGVDNESSMLKFGSKSSRRFHDDSFAAERRTDEDRKLIFSSNKSKSLKDRLGPCPKKSHDPYSSLKTNKSSLKKRLGPRVDDSYHDLKQKCKSLLKKRLGPHPNNFGSLANGKSLLKKRLGLKPQNKNRVTLPWLNLERFSKHKKLTRKGQFDDAGKKSQTDDVEEEGDHSDSNLTNQKTEPREDSEEFKLMVDHAFFRYVKQLYENSEQRRRFIEQGENAKLKCSVCGSDPKEYLDIESLAVHAFESSKVGFRSQHLGYHKAICTIMGWKSEVESESPWVHENLSDDAALLLKEDLVIWPPVVIIHNSSLKRKSSDEHMTVSVEVLESLLKEKGYAEKTKICVGQAANQSIMLVKFNATLSGLQEAQRLHTYYADSKHGKSDLQHIDPASEPPEELPESMSAPPPPPECKIEDVLYGHLGLAEDLDKLGSETKKRCLVKSKKEIQNIANASLKKE